MATWITLLVLLCIVCVLFYVYSWVTHRKVWSMGDKIPGPKVKNGILGNISMFLVKPEKYLPTMMKLFEDFGPVVRVWMGPYLIVFLKDPEDIQTFLKDREARNRPRNLMDAVSFVLGPGLVTHRDEHWKLTRKLFNPTFHPKLLESFMDEFGKNAVILTEGLREVADGRVVNLLHYFTLSTMETVCNTLMSNSKQNRYGDMGVFVNELFQSNNLLMHLSLRPWLLSVPKLYKMTQEGRKTQRFKEVSKKFSSWVISEKMSDIQDGVPPATITTGGNRQISNFVDAMMDASKKDESLFPLDQINAEVVEMAAAATATTSLSMIYALMQIALYPEVQAQIHQELDEVFGSDSRPATMEDIKRLDFLDRCIRESMRLLPAVGTNPREIPKDIQLPSGYVLPANCIAISLSYAVHRDPRCYPDPEKFLPDRWLPENKKNIHPYAYLPFSAGPRDCIGKTYARMQMKVFLSHVLREFAVSPVYDMQSIIDNMTISMVSTLNEERGYPIRLFRR